MRILLRITAAFGFLVSACGSTVALSEATDWPNEILKDGRLLGTSVSGEGDHLAAVASDASAEIVKGGVFGLAIGSTCVSFLEGTHRIRIVFEDSRLFAPGTVSTATVILDPTLPYIRECSNAPEDWRSQHFKAIADRLRIFSSHARQSIRPTESRSECDFDADFRNSFGNDLRQHCGALLWEHSLNTDSMGSTRAFSRIVVDGPNGPRLISFVLTETD